MNLPQHITYGLVVFVAIFLIGWLTGMGGSFMSNFVFVGLICVLAREGFLPAKTLTGRNE